MPMRRRKALSCRDSVTRTVVAAIKAMIAAPFRPGPISSERLFWEVKSLATTMYRSSM